MTREVAPAGEAPSLPKVAWRLARERYADLSGEGARRAGGRWNSTGTAVVYLSQDAALSLLEVLVHLDLGPGLLPADYVLMGVDLSGLATVAGEGCLEEGPTDPMDEPDGRATGDQWLAEGRSLLLRVPSVIVPESFNLLLNPKHDLAKRLPRPTWRPFSFDQRGLES